jgi:uncharacterized membrane protein
MTAVWTAIALAAVANFALKAAGPVAMGGRTLGPRAQKAITLLPGALLAALVVTETFGDGSSLVLDARAAGVAVAVMAIACRAGMLTVLALATITTAAVRALT